MNVIIFYEHLTREWNAVQSLKKELEARGARVKAFSLIFQRTAAWLDSLTHKPDVIYLPWFSIELHEQILDPITRRSPNVVLINQHQEQVGSPSSEVQLIPTTEITKNGCYHFAWGAHFQDLMERNGVDPELIRITGNVRNDAAKAPAVDKQTLAETYGLDANKKWVLFAENRGWLSQRATEATMAEMISQGAVREQLEAALNYEKESLQKLAEDMYQLDASFYEEFELIYRPHPGTQMHLDIPSGVHVLSDRSIYDWICASSLFLTCESTSIFEAELCGVPCATLDHCAKIPEDIMAGVPDYPKINGLTEISMELINRLAKEQAEREPIYQRYIGLVDGLACQRTVEATMQILEKSHQRPPLKKAGLWFNFRQFLFESVTYVSDKLGLLRKLKFPKSAYTESRDIPYSAENKWIRGK